MAALRSPCTVAILLLAFLVGWAHAANYAFTNRRNIPGNDIDCGAKDNNGTPVKFCRVCGGITALADACDANPACKAFDLDGSYCGYLKTAGSASVQTYREGFSSFCKLGAGTSCPGV